MRNRCDKREEHIEYQIALSKCRTCWEPLHNIENRAVTRAKQLLFKIIEEMDKSGFQLSDLQEQFSASSLVRASGAALRLQYGKKTMETLCDLGWCGKGDTKGEYYVTDAGIAVYENARMTKDEREELQEMIWEGLSEYER